MKTFLLLSGHVVLFDDADAELIESRSWRYAKHGNKIKGDKFYVDCASGKSREYLHRMILNVPKGVFVDHINGDTLDNRRCNLRIATASQNMHNRVKPTPERATSRFKGVSRTSCGKWAANICTNRKQKNLGRFLSEVEAAFAYDVASMQLHGPFGKRNFLPFVN